MTRKMLIALLWGTLTVSITSAETVIPGGNVSGTWEASGQPYLIEGDITIPVSDTLTIAPACSIIFQGDYNLTVNGTLEAVGTEADSIHFMPVTTWSGLSFLNAPDSSHLAYCTVSGAINFGGVMCYYSNPVITHSTISNNQGMFWGGINLSNSHPTISYCTINNNTNNDNGGGISMGASSPQISHCDIFGNNTLGIGSGGGISITGGNPSFDHCTINDNQTSSHGGGIAIFGDGQVTITDCIITADTVTSWGGGIYISSPGGSVTINNSTISNCKAFSGGGVYIGQAAIVSINDCAFESNQQYGAGGGGAAIYIDQADTVSLMSSTLDSNMSYGVVPGGVISSANCDNLILNHCNVVNNHHTLLEEGGIILWGNTALTVVNSIFRNQTGYHLWFENYSSASVSYNDFYEPSSYAFSGNVPPGLGAIDTVNANGDPCDTFYNIYMDPLFVDFAGGDYHLTEASPCIDAGDPASPYDPDSTIADMGALFFDQSVTGIERKTNRLIPDEFYLQPPHPNPFNPVTTFKVELTAASWVSLEIFDVAGRSLGFVLDGWRSAGYHEVTFNASGLASGVYVYRLEAGEYKASGKMVLMK